VTPGALPDLLIVGAGPAGVSAALWARSQELTARVLEAAATAGGQLHHVHFHPRDFAGVPDGDGPEIAAVLARQLADSGADVRFEAEAAALEPSADGATVVLGSGERHAARAALVATGVRRRRLDVPGERELEGRGVSYSATKDRAAFAGRPVVVVGGGDAAYENALLLAEVGCPVTLVVRDEPIARPEFQARVGTMRAIAVRYHAHVTAFVGGDQLRAVRVEGGKGSPEIEAVGAVIKVGVVPNTEWCRSALACDPDGYVRANERGRTSDVRVWAAGDVTHPSPPSLAVALGSAALAVADVRRMLSAR
jgi:thioredoxin reductase (NADPH)